MKIVKGQSLIEVLLAVVIFAMAMAGAGALLRSQFSSESSAGLAARAGFLAEEGLDAARIIRDQSWFNLQGGAYGVNTASDMPTLIPGSDTTDVFTRTITITEIDAATRDIESRVSWNEGPLRSRQITLRTRLSDWWILGREDGAWGDWSNPTVNEPQINIGAGGTGVAVRGGIAYLSVASSDNEPDFFILDVSDPTAPTVLGSLSVPGNNRGTDDVAISGDYAYLASRDDNFILHIVDISNPSSPTLISSLSHPADENGRTVAVSGNYAYVGTEEAGDEAPGEEEFLVIDISNPAAPSIIAGIEFDSPIQDIVIEETLAYVAASEDNYGELVIIDISDPGNPTVITDFDPSGSQAGYGVALWPDENLASLVRWSGNPELFTLDISSPTNPIHLGSALAPEHFHKTLIAHPILYASGTHNNEELVIYDISNPNSPQELTSLDLRTNAEGMDFSRNYLYVAVRSESRPLTILTAE